MIRRAALGALLLLTTASPACLHDRPRVVTTFEDGSTVYSDGSSSCRPGAACDDSLWWPCWAVDRPCDEEG